MPNASCMITMAHKSPNDVTIKFSHHQKLLSEGVLRFFDSKCLLDVEVECGGGAIAAHKLILGIFCPAFLKLLPREDSKNKQRVNVDFACDQMQCFAYLLDYLYRGQVTVPRDQLLQMYKLAEQFGVQSLIDTIKTINKKHGFLDEYEKQKSLSTISVKEEQEEWEEEEEMEADEEEDSGEESDKNYEEPLAVESKPRSAKKRKGSKKVSEDSENEDSEPGEKTEEEESGTNSKTQLGLRNRVVNRKQPLNRVAYKRKWRQTRPLIKCSYCDYETRDKYTFKSHMAKHDPTVGGFVCEICSKTFRSKRGFRCHLRGHQDPGELFNCTHCSFYTPQKWSWLQHLAVIHKVDPTGNPIEENVKCPECDYVCVANHQLKAHMIRKHTVDKPFKCPECDYAAVIRYELDKHISIIHRKERPYMCETCGFRSQTQSGFERHKRSHTGVKPFKCDICGQEYADNRKFKTHLSRHVNDEKPFVCHICGHSCRRRDNLQMHLKRIHKASMECESTELQHATNAITTMPVAVINVTAESVPRGPLPTSNPVLDSCSSATPLVTFQMVNLFQAKSGFEPSKSSSSSEENQDSTFFVNSANSSDAAEKSLQTGSLSS